MAKEKKDSAKPLESNQKDSLRKMATKSQEKIAAPRKLKATASAAVKPFKVTRKFVNKPRHIREVENREEKFIHKNRTLTPSYFKNAWKELKQVTWPSNRETIRLAFAVFLFSIIFGTVIAVTDYGLDNLFRKVILK